MNWSIVGGMGLLVSISCFAQSTLPPCPKNNNVRWNNCYGTVTYEDGTKHVGEFKDGKPNGQGTLTYADGTKHVGEFKDGKGNGQGSRIFADGSRVIGDYKDGNLYGQGIRYDTKGQIIASGYFDNDKLVYAAHINPAQFAKIQPNATQSISPELVRFRGHQEPIQPQTA